MAMTYTKTDSGLLVAENRASREAVAAALRDHDRDLRLVPSVDNEHGKVLWKVYSYRGSETPAVFVLAWMDDHRVPLPLSMSLVDRVKQSDRNSRAPRVSEDDLNRQLIEQRRNEQSQIATDVRDDMAPRLTGRTRTILPRSQSLRMSRDKRRARGEKC